MEIDQLDDSFREDTSVQGLKSGDSERSSEINPPSNQLNKETPLPNLGGRPKGDIWQFFAEINNGKGKHKGAICNFCNSSWNRGRANEMKSHLAMKCKGRVPKDIRLNFLREIDNERESSETSSISSSKKRKISNNQTTLENFYDDDKIDEVKSNRADKALIRWFVCSGIPFVAADSPYFDDFTKSLNSGYNPPKRTALATTHLDGELANVTLKIEKELAKAKNLTLSYFLHPTYRGDNLTHNTYKKIILRKALEIWKQTGGGEKSAKILKTQMNLYRNQESPFDDDFIESVDTVKNWWSSCELKKNENHISILALKLHSITPHNASTERVFSVLNWYLCKRRNKMNISHLESLAQIHSFLIANAPGELNFINNNISQDEFTAAFNQIAVAMEEGIDLFEENNSFPVFDDDSEEDNDLQLQNENGLNLEISELIQLNVNQSGSINENQADINESRIEHGDKDFNIEDLLHDN
ncbi:hypothetical protein GLOIN_2v1821413 [Rhizophagus irregularis DAOM 181602=DAOM 197198]|uniref:Uncharacterized protein n=2 Tax=Rhizophagus irregularis (strain DAOM 181602 / DAOM 197198 / MUCL 43194) TaxID=747089 RepID=A0A2P4NZB5_RHIID|nr:hypothetical protein GLOIN_2v1821413 [Rhizophagus irregularis DAOM 181602=DAOM 197198]POG58457.1 hypothetical protein GLOIN_2v1821413 [Rhizophagus irregularis DAOM 181602=DAOM 197198]|eukprot:XP_025165323.1 hypothetical protein GLOIN_2v1821413 [Rhizophagus irregularis DAOM 181602=DAOM 197198]